MELESRCSIHLCPDQEILGVFANLEFPSILRGTGAAMSARFTGKRKFCHFFLTICYHFVDSVLAD